MSMRPAIVPSSRKSRSRMIALLARLTPWASKLTAPRKLPASGSASISIDHKMAPPLVMIWTGRMRSVGASAASSTSTTSSISSPGASAAGAFDDREDFLAHDVFARTTDLARMPVSLACGTSDPFIAANRALAAKLPHAMTTFDAGGHDDGYWRPHGIRALEWCAAALAS